MVGGYARRADGGDEADLLRLQDHLIFTDGFESGSDAAWQPAAPFAGDRVAVGFLDAPLPTQWPRDVPTDQTASGETPAPIATSPLAASSGIATDARSRATSM